MDGILFDSDNTAGSKNAPFYVPLSDTSQGIQEFHETQDFMLERNTASDSAFRIILEMESTISSTHGSTLYHYRKIEISCHITMAGNAQGDHIQNTTCSKLLRILNRLYEDSVISRNDLHLLQLQRQLPALR